MSILLHPTQKTWQGCIEKEDSSVIKSTLYRYKEVVRWDIVIRHLWHKSGFLNCWDSGLADCPNNLYTTWEDAYEWPEMDDFKAGRNLIVFYKIQGVTKDSGGSPLGQVTVELFRTLDDTKQDGCVSDDAGNYVLYSQYNDPHYIRAFKTPNLAGSTVESLYPA
jgi:hypothetical protein